jgi:transcriptional regulator of nitric oxide reductase
VDSGSEYVVAAYAVVLLALLVYVLMVALRTARIQREAELLARLVEQELEPAGDREEEPRGALAPADR